MIPRSPSPVQCVRIFGVLVLLAAVAGMTSGAGLSSSSTSSSSSPTQQVPHQWHPNNLYGDAKESRHNIPTTLACSTVQCPAPIVQPGRVYYKQFRVPCRLHTIQ